jgi:hypothetical protein
MQSRRFKNACGKQGIFSAKIVLIRTLKFVGIGMHLHFYSQLLLNVSVLSNSEHIPRHCMSCNIQVCEQRFIERLEKLIIVNNVGDNSSVSVSHTSCIDISRLFIASHNVMMAPSPFRVASSHACLTKCSHVRLKLRRRGIAEPGRYLAMAYRLIPRMKVSLKSSSL